VLVVEDEPPIAMALADELECAQAKVVGPVATVSQAIEILQSQTPDAAILDVDFHGLSVGPAADWLSKRHIPFVFATGLDGAVPARFAATPICPKPMPPAEVISTPARAIRSTI